MLPLTKVNRQAKNPHISVVIPVFNEADLIQEFLEKITQHMQDITSTFDLIVVDDGSQDQTAAIVKSMCGPLPIQLICFSRNFGKEKAITCGLDHANGQAVLIIDADFQHPLDLIGQFVDKWREGYDNIYGLRSRDDQTLMNRFFANAFYKINATLMNIDLPKDAGDFRLIDQQVVQAIRTLPESNRFMKGLYTWVGFKGIGIPFKVCQRQAGLSRFNFLSLLGLAITGMTSFSDWPLRIWSIIGFFISFFAMVYGLCVAIDTIFFGADVSGWATLVVGMMFLGGVQLISIGVIAEYIARIFNEVKHRPAYIVAEHIMPPKKVTRPSGSKSSQSKAK